MRDTIGILYLSDSLGQLRENPLLKAFLGSIRWAENQGGPRFSSDDQRAVENLLPPSFPLLNSLFLPPVL